MEEIFCDICEDKMHDECGVIGIVNKGNKEVGKLVYYGLIALQHRGQESAGIAVNSGGHITCYKEMGLVLDVFTNTILELLNGDMSIGHVRYSPKAENYVENAHPHIIEYKGGTFSIAFNGEIVNEAELKTLLKDEGRHFDTNSHAEFLGKLIRRNFEGSMSDAIEKTMGMLKGAYAMVIMTNDKVIGVRDKHGLRPLVLGKMENGYVIASENCAFDTIGAELIRDVKPGEIVIIDRDGYMSIDTHVNEKKATCIFEHVYVARPDSTIDGKSVYLAREMAGRLLAKQAPVEADIVIAVPDSGTPAAIGFANESGIPYSVGLIKNRYIGRTFIKPTQTLREVGVKLKLNPMRHAVAGKRVVMVDDSIVRGTTSKQIILALRNAGATEVHVRSASPTVVECCKYGIDTPSKDELIACKHTIDEINDIIGADSLAFLNLDGLHKAVDSASGEGFCSLCFNGIDPLE